MVLETELYGYSAYIDAIISIQSCSKVNWPCRPKVISPDSHQRECAPHSEA